MKAVTIDVDLPDDAHHDIDALVIVYHDAVGVHSSFRVFPTSPVPPLSCAVAASKALKNYSERFANAMSETDGRTPS